MTDELAADALVSGLHAKGTQFVLAITGGGTSALARLLTVPGGSRTLLEAIVPYSAESLADFLHARPEHFCSAVTARSMAMAAFSRGRQLQQMASPGAVHQPHVIRESNLPIGLGCTASLASDRPKRGPHRIHISWQSAAATMTYSLELSKGQRSRREEEEIAAILLLNALANAVGLAQRLDMRLIDAEHVVSQRTDAPAAWQELLLGRAKGLRQALSATGDIQFQSLGEAVGSDRPRAIFPGAFNPLHSAHLRVADLAAKRLGVPVECELSIENVDKPPLDYTEMRSRAAPFIDQHLPLWLTRAATFEQKSELFPGATFIVGADTIERIGQAKYYGDSARAAEDAIARIREHGCRFLVFGRVCQGEFQSLADLQLPSSLRNLCDRGACCRLPRRYFGHAVAASGARQCRRLINSCSAAVL